MANDPRAVAQYVREFESVDQLIDTYGNTREYARRVWGCSPQVAAIVKDLLDGGPAR